MPDSVQDIAVTQEPPTGAPPARVWTDEEKVEYLYVRQWTAARIARKCRIGRARVKAIMDKIDDDKIRELAEGSPKRRAIHTAFYQEIAREVYDDYRKHKKANGGIGNGRTLRVAIEALSKVRDIHGDDAPAKQINLNLSGKTLVHPADQQALVNADPRIRDELLAINARRRALGLPVRRDGPGGVHGDGRGGLGHDDEPTGEPVAPGAAPGRNQQVPHEGDVG